MVVGIDCICSCKSNYHRITTTTDPDFSGIRVARSLVFIIVFVDYCLFFFVFFILTIALYVLQCNASNYPVLHHQAVLDYSPERQNRVIFGTLPSGTSSCYFDFSG